MRGILLTGVVLGFVAVSARPASARVTLSGVMERERATITIYRSDVSLVQEWRTVGLRRGDNVLQLDWAGVNIDPMSLRLTTPPGSGLTLTDTALADNAQAVHWTVNAAAAKEVPLSVSYYLRGLSWSTEYTAWLDAEEKHLTLTGDAVLVNRSGEDFRGVAVRLLLGDLRFMSPAMLAAKSQVAQAPALAGRAMDSMAMEAMPAPPAFEQEQLADYNLFALPKPVDLISGETRRLPLLESKLIEFKRVYRFDPRINGQWPMVHFRIDNKEDVGLGRALPPGIVRAFRADAQGVLSLVGEDLLDYRPVGEEVRLFFGFSRDIVVEAKQMAINYEPAPSRQGQQAHYVVRDFQVTVRNRRTEASNVEIRQYYQGKVDKASDEYKDIDANTIQFAFSLKAGDTKVITYRTREFQWGPAPEQP